MWRHKSETGCDHSTTNLTESFPNLRSDSQKVWSAHSQGSRFEICTRPGRCLKRDLFRSRVAAQCRVVFGFLQNNFDSTRWLNLRVIHHFDQHSMNPLQIWQCPICFFTEIVLFKNKHWLLFLNKRARAILGVICRQKNQTHKNCDHFRFASQTRFGLTCVLCDSTAMLEDDSALFRRIARGPGEATRFRTESIDCIRKVQNNGKIEKNTREMCELC